MNDWGEAYLTLCAVTSQRHMRIRHEIFLCLRCDDSPCYIWQIKVYRIFN